MPRCLPWLLLLALTPALAQDPPPPPPPDPRGVASLDPFQEFGKRIKASSMVEPLGSSLFGDQISLYNGGTEFSVVDVDLPGNNALKVQVARRFQVADRRRTEDRPGFGEWELDVPYLHGVYAHNNEWTVGDNNLTSRCSTTQPPPTTGGFQPEEFWHGASLHLPGQGDLELLVNDQPSLPAITGGVAHPWITKGFIRLRCTNLINGAGEGFIAVTPEGIRYTFNRMIVRASTALTRPYSNGGNPLLRDRVYLVATQVEDRFGNTVSYNYTGDQLTTITSSDGRSITLAYGNDDLIDTVTVNSTPSRTWHYDYEEELSELPPGFPESLLILVTRPDGSAWHYAVTAGGFTYHPSAFKPGDPSLCPEPGLPENGILKYKITHPAGAIGTFDFSFRRHYRVLWDKSQIACIGQDPYFALRYPNYFDVWSLTQKTLSGAAIPAPLTWTYAYGDNAGVLLPCPSCDPTKDVIVTEPDGAKSISRFGVLFEVNEGRLLGEEVRSPATASPPNAILRSTVHSYASAAGTYPDVYGTSLITGFDPVANRIRPLTGTTITQQGKTFSATHSNFDVFGRAQDHARASNLAGNPSKTERSTFHDDYDIWVLGQPKRTLLLGSPDIEISETTYDATFALPQTHEVYSRLDRSFEWHTADDTVEERLKRGRLWRLKDAQNRAYVLDDYYRGVPRSLVLPTSASHTMLATVDYFGNLLSVTDAVEFKTEYQYDALDRLKRIDYPIGDTVSWVPTTITYAPTEIIEHGIPAGLWKRTETTGTLVKETWFDAFWRPILARESASDASTTATFWRRGFDHRNRQTFATYPLPSLPSPSGSYLGATVGTTTTFDALDRTTTIQAASELTPSTLTTTFTYDLNFITRVQDARGFQTSTSFLAWDTPSTEFPTEIQAPEGQTTTILRDVFGKPRKLRRSGMWGDGPIAVDRDYVYDAHQRLCKTLEPESKATIIDYDSVNQIAWTAIGQNLTSLSDCERSSVSTGQKSMHGYDAMNRLLSIDHPTGTEDVAYTYFADGALQTASTVPQLTFPPTPSATPTNTWTYAYNKRRLLELETLSYDSRSFELDWSYNNRGQMASLVYPGGASLDWAPDARGRPRQAHGSAANFATVNSNGRHANGAMATMTYGNGLSLSTAQNLRQLPSSRAVGSLMNYVLTYDQNANLATITDAIGPETRTMAYDGLNRMTQAHAPAVLGNETYVYDPIDNVRSARFGPTNATFTHRYDASHNRLDAIDFNDAPFLDYDYNDRGDATLRQFIGPLFANGFETTPPAATFNPSRRWAESTAPVQSFSYDRAHRLTAVAGIESYVYDAHGRRVATLRATDGSRRYQVYSRSGQMLYTEDRRSGLSIPNEIVDYIHIDGDLVAERSRPLAGAPVTVRYQYTDMRGTPVVQEDALGQLRRRVYEPYGSTADDTYVDGPGFTGHATDASTGLSYMQQRYYDPIAFRFLSPDPVAANPGSFSRYWYANNNPMKYVDPDGQFALVIPLVPPAMAGLAKGAAFLGTAAIALLAGNEAINAYNEISPKEETDGRIDKAKEGLTPAPGASGEKGHMEGDPAKADEIKGALGVENEREVRRGEGGTAKIGSLPDGSRVIDYKSGGGDGKGGSGDEYPPGTRTIQIQRPTGSADEKWRFPEKKL